MDIILKVSFAVTYYAALYFVSAYFLKKKNLAAFFLFIVISATVSCAAEIIRTFHVSPQDLFRDFSIVTIIAIPLCLSGAGHFFVYIKNKISSKPNKSDVADITPWHKPVMAICVILFFIMISEFTLFNYHHYRTLFSDGRLDINSFEIEKTDMLSIKNINMRVSSIYIDADFISDHQIQTLYIEFSDEEGTSRRTPDFVILKNFNKSRYVPLATHGRVSNITIHYVDKQSVINSVVLNKPIPLEYHLLRIILLLLFFFSIWFVRYKNLMSVKIDFDSKPQLAAIRILVLLVFALIWWTASTSDEEYVLDQYNHKLVDAFMAGQVNLNIPALPKLLEMDRPHDIQERADRGLIRGVDYHWDHVYYEGKWYSYFGIVPVLILFLPFKVIAGFYLQTSVAVVIFCCASAWLLVLIWHELIKKFMKNMPFVLYIMGAAVMALTPMTLHMARTPRVYEAAVMSGLAFAAAGLLCLIKATVDEKISFKHLAFASIFLALSVGCRPTLVLISLFLPLFLLPWLATLWKDKKQLIKVALCVIPAYAIVATGLMYYNYIRFGSVTEFGVTYQVTVADVSKFSLLNPISKIDKALYGLRMYLFAPLEFSAGFPFVKPYTGEINYMGYIYFHDIIGLINYPIVWLLVLLPFLKADIRERSKLLWRMFLLMPAIALFMIVIATGIGGFNARYHVDYMWMFIIMSLVCAYFLHEKLCGQPQVQMGVLKLFCVMCTATIAVALLTSITGEWDRLYDYDPHIYYYIMDLFGIWRQGT